MPRFGANAKIRLTLISEIFHRKGAIVLVATARNASVGYKKFLKEVYIKLNNYFQIAYGEGFNQQFSFNLNQFCAHYNFPVLKTYNALQFLDRQGIITLLNENSEKVKIIPKNIF